jgi:hypothetical protein
MNEKRGRNKIRIIEKSRELLRKTGRISQSMNYIK